MGTKASFCHYGIQSKYCRRHKELSQAYILTEWGLVNRCLSYLRLDDRLGNTQIRARYDTFPRYYRTIHGGAQPLQASMRRSAECCLLKQGFKLNSQVYRHFYQCFASKITGLVIRYDSESSLAPALFAYIHPLPHVPYNAGAFRFYVLGMFDCASTLCLMSK